MANSSRIERRKENREVHVDRRKSDIDVFEHVILGVRRAHFRAASEVTARLGPAIVAR